MTPSILLEGLTDYNVKQKYSRGTNPWLSSKDFEIFIDRCLKYAVTVFSVDIYEINSRNPQLIQSIRNPEDDQFFLLSDYCMTWMVHLLHTIPANILFTLNPGIDSTACLFVPDLRWRTLTQAGV